MHPGKPVINSVYLSTINSVEQSNSAAKVVRNKKEISNAGEEKKTDPSSTASGKNILITDADTSNLVQVYRESSLNVTIKYPNGWTYIDQNLKNKLDGVTFWFTKYNGQSPPYVHLEVRDKDIFSPGRYKYHQKLNDYTLYYNEPMELQNQFSQEVYIRTGSNEDFSIKLIIEGKTNFQAFQPEFFGMIKSFKFSNSIF